MGWKDGEGMGTSNMNMASFVAVFGDSNYNLVGTQYIGKAITKFWGFGTYFGL